MSDRECTYVTNEYDLVIGVTPIEILPSDPDRVAVVFSYTGSGAFNVSMNSPVYNNLGLQVGSFNEVVAISDDRMPGMAGQKWYAVAGAANIKLTVFTVKRLYG
jgi:hypothetical protein